MQQGISDAVWGLRVGQQGSISSTMWGVGCSREPFRLCGHPPPPRLTTPPSLTTNRLLWEVLPTQSLDHLLERTEQGGWAAQGFCTKATAAAVGPTLTARSLPAARNAVHCLCLSQPLQIPLRVAGGVPS